MRTAVDHRPAILKTAARLFGRRPYHEVLMEDVAAGAGVAKGTIYRFYPTKEDLYAAISLESLGILNASLRRIAAEPNLATERLNEMILGVVEHFHRKRDAFRVIQREWSAGHSPKRSAFLARRAEAVKLIVRVLRQGCTTGEFRKMDVPAAADMLLGMVRSMVRFGDPRLSPQAISRVVADVFLRGISRGKD